MKNEDKSIQESGDRIQKERRMKNVFLNQDTYPFRQPGDVRVMYTIAIDRVSAMG